MSTAKIIKAYTAQVDLGHGRAVKPGATDGTVTIAGAADRAIGVTDCPGGITAGEVVDVVHLGITDMVIGDGPGGAGTTSAAGMPLRALAAGAVGQTPSTADTSYWTVGWPTVTSSPGDIVPCMVLPGRVTF
ncbi:hypothetical protein P7L78_26460 [Tistrella bauzanensis]|uniref:hypothetical protein n=1 Tax=Tistrella TaxID=171436 RepID=UPI0031F6C508